MRSLLALTLLISACGADPLEAARPDDAGDAQEARVVVRDEAPSERQEATASPVRIQGRFPFVEGEAHWPTITGQVIDERSQEPVEGCRVRVSWGEVNTYQKTDAEGLFAIPVDPAVDDARLRVQPRYQWRWRRPSEWRGGIRLDPSELAEAEPLRLTIAELVPGDVRGVALDGEGRPLAGIAFRLVTHTLGYRTQDVRTDGAGLFTVRLEKGGEFAAHGLPGEPVPLDTELRDLLTGDQQLHEFRFQRGISVPIELGGSVPAGVAALEARLYPFGSPKPLAVSALSPLGGDTVQAVFSVLPTRVATTATLELVVVDDEGMLHGQVPVGWEELETGSGQSIELAAAGVVAVKGHTPLAIARKQHQPLEHSRHLTLETELPSVQGWQLKTGRWLPPGAYRVAHRVRGCEPVDLPVQVEAGETFVIDAEARPTEVREVRVLFLDESGEGLPACDLELSIQGQPWNRWNGYLLSEPLFCGTGIDAARMLDEEVDPKEGHFHYARIPPGRLQVEVDSPGVFWRVDVDGEDDQDQFLTLTRVTLSTGFGFRVVTDASDAYRFPRVTVWERDGEPLAIRGFQLGALCGQGDPTGRRFDWAVQSPSRRTIFGDQDDFLEVEPGRWFADLAFEEGLSAVRLELRDEGGHPLAGVRVLEGDEEIGATDANGQLLMQGVPARRRLVMDLDGWSVTEREERGPFWRWTLRSD